MEETEESWNNSVLHPRPAANPSWCLASHFSEFSLSHSVTGGLIWMMSDAPSNSHDNGSKSQMLEEAQGPRAARRKDASTWNRTSAHVFRVGEAQVWGRSCPPVWAQGESCLVVCHPPWTLKLNTWLDEVAEEAPEWCTLAACPHTAGSRNSTLRAEGCPGACPSWWFTQQVSVTCCGR